MITETDKKAFSLYILACFIVFCIYSVSVGAESKKQAEIEHIGVCVGKHGTHTIYSNTILKGNKIIDQHDHRRLGATCDFIMYK